MDTEALVYVDLEGQLVLVGRLWARMRKGRDSASFEYDEEWLSKLGRDIRDARLRRRIPTAIMAERASVSRTTLNKVEKGDPGASLGIYATVLFVLGLADRIGDLADIHPVKNRLDAVARPFCSNSAAANSEGFIWWQLV